MKAKSYISSKKELAKNLKMARMKLKITQCQLSQMLKIDHSTYSCYEAGKTLPNIFTLIKISSILKTDLSNLIIKQNSLK